MQDVAPVAELKRCGKLRHAIDEQLTLLAAADAEDLVVDVELRAERRTMRDN